MLHLCSCYVKEGFISPNDIERVVKIYNLFNGKGWVGGIFPKKILKKSHYVSIYNTMKIGLESNNYKVFENELDLLFELISSMEAN